MDYSNKDYKKSNTKIESNDNKNNRNINKENKSAIGDYERKSLIGTNSFLSYN